MRISKMITLKRNALILYQILSTNSLTKCMEISLENLYSKNKFELQRPSLYSVTSPYKHLSIADMSWLLEGDMEIFGI